MVRETRIKTLRFPNDFSSTNGIFSAATTGSFVSDNIVNGEILQVEWVSNRTGSVAISYGNNQEEFFIKTNISGTGIQVARPRILAESSAGVAATDAFVPYVGAGNIVMNLTGVASGTSALDVKVRYR